MYGGSAYAASPYAGSNMAFAPPPPSIPGHGTIIDFDPFGAGGAITDGPSPGGGSILDFPTTGGSVTDR